MRDDTSIENGIHGAILTQDFKDVLCALKEVL